MGSKPRPPRFRSALSLEDAKEIHDELSRQWHASKALHKFLLKLTSWIDAQ